MAKKKSSINSKTMTKSQKEDLLIENFVGLQKAMTHLSLRFETLSNNLSKLLGVLELSAREYLTKKLPGEEGSPEILKQVNYLIEQNKAIAEGLLLIDDTIRAKNNKDGGPKESRDLSFKGQQPLKTKILPKTI